jgi:prevent-host-death family protein
MQVVNIYEAKTHLSRLIEQALHGEEVIIGKAGKPIIRLVPYDDECQDRKPGYWQGKVKMADDFDDLPAHILQAFNGEESK